MATKYTDLDGPARYAAVDEMAREVFGTHWKGQLAAYYGLTPAAVTKWRNAGAPIWATVALSDLYRATLLERAIGAKQAN